jgi:glycine cleavage system H protein
VFIEGPKPGAALVKGKEAAVVESVKAASDVYSPITGTVTEGNTAVELDPALVNTDAEGAGWFFKLTIADMGELDGLMDEAAYRDLVASLA